MQQSPTFEFVLHGDGGLSKAHIARHSSPLPLAHVITSMVANHAPSMPILSQFPSGSVSVNLAFQLSDKTLKALYACRSYPTSPILLNIANLLAKISMSSIALTYMAGKFLYRALCVPYIVIIQCSIVEIVHIFSGLYHCSPGFTA